MIRSINTWVGKARVIYGNFDRGIVSNTYWLIGEKVLRLLLGLLVGLLTARYLGPANFGKLSFVLAFAAMFTPVATLGLEGIVIRELVNKPDERNSIIGSAYILKLLGGVVGYIGSLLIIWFIAKDRESIILVAILSSTMVFQSLDVIDYYYQSQILSKFVVISRLSSFLLFVLLRIGFVFYKMPLIAFVIAFSLEISLACLFLGAQFMAKMGKTLHWQYSNRIAKSLLADCWPLIFSSAMIMLYMRIDQVMLKYMATDSDLGKYSASVRIAEMWYFIPMSIVASIFPKIMSSSSESEGIFKKRMQSLYDMMCGIGYLVAIPVTFLSEHIVLLLYGKQYEGSGAMLSISIWAGIFVGLGVARSSFLTAKNWMKFHLVSVTLGCIANICLNYLFIPNFGARGASVATLLAQIMAAFLSCFFYKPTVETGIMMLRSLSPVHLIRQLARL